MSFTNRFKSLMQYVPMILLLGISLLMLQCGHSGNESSQVTFAVGDELIMPVVNGKGKTGTLIDLYDDGEVDGIDLDGDLSTCELMLLSVDGDVYSFCSNGDGEADLFLMILDSETGQAVTNDNADFTGSPVNIVKSSNGDAIGLDSDGDGMLNICVVPVKSSGDTIPPEVESFSPLAGATNVATNCKITVTFSECMDSYTISEDSFTVTNGGIPVSGELIYDENSRTAIFLPTENMDISTIYTVSMSTIISDSGGNGLSEIKSWSFTTGEGEDIAASVPGNSGELTVTDTTSTSLTLNWEPAADDMTQREELMYKVVLSTSDPDDFTIKSETDITGGQEILLLDWTANIYTLQVTNLTSSTTYYFKVFVRDMAFNTTSYVRHEETTGESPDTAAPVPGDSGTIIPASASETSVTLNWAAATDDVSFQVNLKYIVFYSLDNNIESVEKCEENGTAVGSYKTNLTTREVAGLTDHTTYYFNVVVKDEAGNKNAYTVQSQTTLVLPDMIAPIAGSSGEITATDVETTSLTLNWTAATDNFSTQENIQYLTYYSTVNNIGTVSDCESNGTVIGSYARNILTKIVDGLNPSTTYYFNVLIRDEADNKASYTTLAQATLRENDSIAPTPGNSGIVTASNVSDSTLTLAWTAATDNTSSVENLQYLAYYSTSNNIDSVANCESNGTPVGSFTANITSTPVDGLSTLTTYYFNVVVKDEDNNQTAYTTLAQAMTDNTNPTAGNSGIVTASNVSDSTLTLAWTAATDNTSSVENLQYLAYYSTSNNIDSVANCESNGTPVGSYTANITSTPVDGLSLFITYYFNVVVKDEGGNKTAYTTLSQAMTDNTNPTAGNSGRISAGSATNSTITLRWKGATDNGTVQTNLSYLVYYSTSNNIGSVADCESNGRPFGVYTENMTAKTVFGLAASTTYYFNVVVKDSSGNKTPYKSISHRTTGPVVIVPPADTQRPVPGNSGTITSAGVAATTLTLNWTAATDNASAQADLQYLAYYSTSNNIDTPANCVSNGTPVGSYTANIATKDVTGLTASTTYYFNVAVKDEADNYAAYSTLTQATTAAPDTTDPTPGNSGTITSAAITDTTLTLNWTAATDNVTSAANLQYLAYYSTSNNIDTPANCVSNGTPIGSCTANIATKNVTGLTASTTYYFNVVVKDEADNYAAYSTLTQATTPAPDTTDPTPGNSGTITSASVATTTLTLNWTAATDNVTSAANLEYLAYYSTSNNIDTPANCVSNGTPVGSYTANIATKDVTGLTSGTTYYFNVVVKDTSDNYAAYTTLTQATADGTSPTPGNSGTITSASVADTTLTLNWTAATDNVTSAANLQYLAYYSTSNNIGTPANCVSNGTPVGSYTANIATKDVTGLTASTTYYFNVVVKDEADNYAVYSTLTQATTAPADSTAPTPGNSGTITSASVTNTTLTLNWTAATDNVTSAANLQYLAYYSTSDNIGSPANCVSNGTPVGSYTANIATKDVTGLTADTTYYFNVVVKDEADNYAAYTTLTQATAAGIPSDYVIRWKLNNNGNDEKGGYDLSSATGSPGYSTSSPKEGTHYFSVDGNDDIYSSSYAIPNDKISISLWVYIDPSVPAGTNPGIIDINGLGMYYVENAGVIKGVPGSSYVQASVSTGTWYHVVMTYDGSTNAKMYLDKVEVDSFGISGNINTISGPWYIGSASGSNFWDGYIDDVIVYDRQLSATEVGNIYDSY